jgi:hypothetical protein
VPALPWASFSEVEDNKQYPALLSHLPLATFRAMPKFFRFVFGIRRQLAESEGLIGYSLERVMNSIRNGLGMRETEIAKEPSRPCNPHSYAVFAQVHNTL